MPQIGGKNAKKKSSSSSTKRHFTVVMGNKEHGLYVSSSPSSAARKAVSKLCATDKKKKVQFHIREITQGSKKKTYGPYLGEIEKLAKPIELKGRVIKYKPVAKLSGKKTKTGGAKKRGSILVVEVKDGKVSKKYITKKQADKHMKPRHKRLDKGMKPLHKSMDKSMKKLHKSMRGGGMYECYIFINGTQHKFKIEKGPLDGEYTLTFLYKGDDYDENSKYPTNNDIRKEGRSMNSIICGHLNSNSLQFYLNKNKRNIVCTLSTDKRKFNYLEKNLDLLLNNVSHLNIKDSTLIDKPDHNSREHISKEQLFDRIIKAINATNSTNDTNNLFSLKRIKNGIND